MKNVFEIQFVETTVHTATVVATSKAKAEEMGKKLYSDGQMKKAEDYVTTLHTVGVSAGPSAKFEKLKKELTALNPLKDVWFYVSPRAGYVLCAEFDKDKYLLRKIPLETVIEKNGSLVHLTWGKLVKPTTVSMVDSDEFRSWANWFANHKPDFIGRNDNTKNALLLIAKSVARENAICEFIETIEEPQIAKKAVSKKKGGRKHA